MIDLEQEYLQARARNRHEQNNIIQRFVARNLLPAAATTGTFRDKFGRWADISKYQQRIDWDKFHADFDGVFIRAGLGSDVQGHGGFIDSLFATHIQNAYDHDVCAVAYFVLDPGYYFDKLQSLGKLKLIDQYLPVDKDEQIQTLVKALKFKKIYGLAIDYEMMKDWYGNVMPDGWLTEIIFQFLVRVRKLYPDLPIIFYSGSWFVWNYCKTLESTGRIKDLALLWTAYYPYGAGIIPLQTGADILAHMPPETMTIKFPDGSRQTQNPPYLGFDGWVWWQINDKFTLPYITDDLLRPSGVDVNLGNGTKEKQWAILNFTPKGTPEPPPIPPDNPPVNEDLAALQKRVDAVVAEQAIIELDLKAIEDKLAAVKAAL